MKYLNYTVHPSFIPRLNTHGIRIVNQQMKPNKGISMQTLEILYSLFSNSPFATQKTA